MDILKAYHFLVSRNAQLSTPRNQRANNHDLTRYVNL